MKLSWSHCVMYVRDLEATIAFYDEMLGFKVSDRGPLIPGNDDTASIPPAASTRALIMTMTSGDMPTMASTDTGLKPLN